jgi:hypothetical protein
MKPNPQAGQAFQVNKDSVLIMSVVNGSTGIELRRECHHILAKSNKNNNVMI